MPIHASICKKTSLILQQKQSIIYGGDPEIAAVLLMAQLSR